MSGARSFGRSISWCGVLWRIACFACRMNSAWGGLWPTVGLRRPRRGFASAEADAWRGAPVEADFNRRESLQPMVGLGCRMNSASRGLRPVVGLRRPEKHPLPRRRPTPGAERLWRPISIGVRSYAVGAQLGHSHRHMWGVLADHSPHMGLPSRQLRKSYGVKACADREVSFASAKADAWRVAPLEVEFIRRHIGRGPAATPAPLPAGAPGWPASAPSIRRPDGV
jgi:hypothetical protein